MSDDGYVRLSGLDHAFLHFETPPTYMHVALTAIFDGGSLARPDGGIDIERVRRHVASRLHLLPRYRQRLHFVPVTGDPVWVDDDAFDLDLHVRHSHLPCPGTDQQLKSLIARLLERPLGAYGPELATTVLGQLVALEAALGPLVRAVQQCQGTATAPPPKEVP